MSKYSDSLERQFKDIKSIKKATKGIIKNGKKLSLEEYHDATSLERLKRRILEK